MASTSVNVTSREILFEDVCSVDFLNFKFGGRGYQDQLYDSISKTECLAGVQVERLNLGNGASIVWVTHNFSFLGGSLGCAEGEKITRAFEYGLAHKLPVAVQCRSGGARMQEGTSSLMQMAKVSVAVEALRRAGLPFVAVLLDPTYGGVSASYAMQGDVRVASSDARVGFAGPQVILNTMCEADQGKFDASCPADFQSADYVYQHGQVDVVFPLIEGESKAQTQSRLENFVIRVTSMLLTRTVKNSTAAQLLHSNGSAPESEDESKATFDYTRSRRMDRPQTQDIIATVFDESSFVELSGDGCVGRDVCMRGGLASLDGRPCVVVGTFKGHTPGSMQAANYGMASPHGYRTALRLMRLAERFGLPVVTLVDTVGAWPTFECERDGQSEAIATNLTAMAGLRVPVVTLLVGEGGSGGALGIGMGNIVGMLSGGYFGVISPEGAASILGRYKDAAHKARQFPLDCQELATAQCIYANQLKELGVVDEIVWEDQGAGQAESYTHFPDLRRRVLSFLTRSLHVLQHMDADALVQQRYNKYRAVGTFLSLDAAGRSAAMTEARSKKGPLKPVQAPEPALPVSLTQLLTHLAEETIGGTMSRFKGRAPSNCPLDPPVAKVPTPSDLNAGRKRLRIANPNSSEPWTNAKRVLDKEGPEGLARWVRKQTKVLITDTTMRDAHQSLLATRVRTKDIVAGAHIAQAVLKDAFSLECWGGATFDVAMRFLDECPWDRLRALRTACPDLCLQMLIRGANGVGYTSYADNVVVEFIRLAAANGLDVFRIFDCFNIVENMRVSIDAVRAVGKVAEVCLCYTGNVLTSTIYDLAYYQSVAKEAVAAGAHMICIKDMAGLLRPLEAEPLLRAIRAVIPEHMPVHLHTHATSSAAVATCIAIAEAGCDIVDVCSASMADGTSQPSMNAFVACLEGAPYDTGIDYLTLEGYDAYWSRVRSMYSPFESGMLSGSARVYDHQIPGGQYSNLLVQCASMGLASRWEEVLDGYRDVNELLGDIVKVTPSSKCVGDLALYLVTRGMKASDLLSNSNSIDWPDSVVGLLRGEIGLPHRGFPPAVEAAILKGRDKLTQRAGLTLPPVDFEANIQKLSAQFGFTVSAEQAMSSLMYPKVFADYIKRQQKKGGLLLEALPTPVYLYGAALGHEFTISRYGQDTTADTRLKLTRVSPLQRGSRAVVWSVDGREVSVLVQDKSNVFVFDGPMADSSQPGQLASPMPGVVEKSIVGEGQRVSGGDVLCTISAMKMEVKVTAPGSGTVKTVNAPAGTKVVEGALLVTLLLD